MVVDAIYQVSVFGDFDDIKATPENMLFAINSFSEYGLMPSVSQEFNFDIVNMNSPKITQRIMLISDDEGTVVTVNSGRIDVKFDTVKLSQQFDFNRRAVQIISKLLDQFGKKGTRLALNTLRRVQDLGYKDLQKIVGNYGGKFAYFSKEDLTEWGCHLATRGSLSIGQLGRSCNIITNYSTAPQESESVVELDIAIDINTVQGRGDCQFNGDDLGEFLRGAQAIRQAILQSDEEAREAPKESKE